MTGMQCWLVERSYSDRDLVTLVSATSDGERAHMTEIPMTAIDNGTVTADRREPVDGERRDADSPNLDLLIFRSRSGNEHCVGSIDGINSRHPQGPLLAVTPP